MALCPVCRNLDYNEFPIVDDATERVLGRLLRSKLLNLRRSAGQGCHSCMILRDGIHAVDSSSQREEIEDIPVSIRLRRERSIELIVGDVEDCVTIEFYIHPGQVTPWKAFGVAQHVPTHLNMATCLHHIRKWFQLCNEGHPHCKPKLDLQTELPTRVLDIGGREDSQLVQVHETGSSESAPYMTLSHCWGEKQIVTTTKSTLARHRLGLHWSELSRTFQDAVNITRELGIRYIWIDSLCIIQDDDTDWKEESGKMSAVYSNSYLNLAATHSPNGDGGCFSSRWTSSRNYRSPVISHEITQRMKGQTISVYARQVLKDAHLHFTELEPLSAEEFSKAAPLLSRAWVAQERFLSPRTLHFHATELVWECNESLLCECGGLDERQNPSLQRNRPKSAFADAFAGNKDTEGLCELWYHLITLYSRLKLTKESDRLPALAGLADRLIKVSGDAYFDGIWRSHLPQALLWQACPSLSGESSRTRLETGGIPTWSWASVQFRDSDFDGFISYENVTLAGFEPDPRLFIYGISSISGDIQIGTADRPPPATLSLRGALISTTLIHDHPSGSTSSLLVHDRNDTHDCVFVSREDLITDFSLYRAGAEQLLDGTSLKCLLIGHTTEDMARDGEAPIFSDLSIVLKQIESHGEIGAYERIGMLQSQRDEDWFREAAETLIKIV